MQKRLGDARPSLAVRLLALSAVVACLVSVSTAQAQSLAPPTDFTVIDRPSDNGDALVLRWTASTSDDLNASPKVFEYHVYRRKAGETDWGEKHTDAPYGNTSKTDDQNIDMESVFEYRIIAVDAEGNESIPVDFLEGVSAKRQWFDQTKAWFGILLFIVCGSVVFFIEVARGGKDLKVRKIAGLAAVEEAVGRATELGRPVLFVNGIQDINDIQTVAGITVLANVARKVAEYDAEIEVPTSRSLVMTTARETVQASYLSAGRPDAYKEDNIYYLTDEQFGFVAGVTGSMVRKKYAACFYMGAFYAESLILAETGNSIGAIQVAGTAMPSQLPFFVAACDYTLIGEEFFAASAYLSGEPHQLGSLKGQDLGKLIGAVLIVVGCAAATIAAITTDPGAAPGLFGNVAGFIRDNVLGSGGLLP